MTDLPDWLKPTGTKNTTMSSTPDAGATDTGEYGRIVNLLKGMPKKDRVAIAKRLAALNFKVPTTGAITPDFVNSFWQASSEQAQWSPIYGNQQFTDYLDTRIANQGATGGGSGGPRTVSSTAISSPTSAKGSIRDMMAQQLGRYPTDEEVRAYTAKLQAAQRKNPTRTTYSADGTSVVTTGGLDEQQFLFDQFAGNDEAKRNRALQAYTYILQSVFGAGD